eukprot:12208660-Karenia_brevis.AAC.1
MQHPTSRAVGSYLSDSGKIPIAPMSLSQQAARLQNTVIYFGIDKSRPPQCCPLQAIPGKRPQHTMFA